LLVFELWFENLSNNRRSRRRERRRGVWPSSGRTCLRNAAGRLGRRGRLSVISLISFIDWQLLHLKTSLAPVRRRARWKSGRH